MRIFFVTTSWLEQIKNLVYLHSKLNFDAMKKFLLLSVCFFSLCTNSQVIGLTQFATGFTAAVAIEHPVNDARLFVVEQGGLIRIVNSNGTINATPFLNVSSLTTPSGEKGLLGLAFHPNYASNGLFFVNYTRASDGNTVIARYNVSADPSIANPTGTILMIISQPASNHNGGTLRFGSDGYLYIGMGDGGGAGDTSGYAQNLDLAHAQVAINPSRIYLGKMLRIDVNTTAPGLNYGFPPTNPYVAQAGKQEIWAIGLRNPWKFSFNRLNGDLWIADVGQGSIEEINKITTPLPTGLNFGWRCYEGNATYSSTILPCPTYASTVAPLTQYTHTGGRCSVTGGYYYTGTNFPNFQNKYFIADFCTAEIGTVSTAGVITWGYDALGYAGSFGEDMNGELYISISTQYSATTPSTIYKIIDSSLINSDFEKNGFSLYPNPTNDTFFIKSSNDVMVSKIELYDVTGKLLLSKKAETTSENSISVSNFAKGMYLVKVETTTGKKYTSKLIVE